MKNKYSKLALCPQFMWWINGEMGLSLLPCADYGKFERWIIAGENISLVIGFEGL